MISLYERLRDASVTELRKPLLFFAIPRRQVSKGRHGILDSSNASSVCLLSSDVYRRLPDESRLSVAGGVGAMLHQPATVARYGSAIKRRSVFLVSEVDIMVRFAEEVRG